MIRGTALRDALGFIRFTDFTNQIEFAAVANALNDRVAAAVLAPLDFETLAGRTISFIGAVDTRAVREDGAIEIVPVRIAVSERRAR